MNRLPVYAFATLLLAVVAILIVPLPPWLLDVLLAVNIFGSSLVLLLSVTVEEPLQFSRPRCWWRRSSGFRSTSRPHA